MITLIPSKKQIQESKDYLSKYPNGYTANSYRNGGISLQSGKLAEICFRDYFGGSWVNHYDYDFIFKNKRIEIKTKACSNYTPQDEWYCSIPDYYDQNTDYYLFARTSRELDKLWFVGYISKQEFNEKSVFVKEGQVDPDSSPNKTWVCPVDSHYIKIKELKKDFENI